MMKKINEMRELQKKKGKKGFSMIELIIVIAIMAILIALIGTQLIPYLNKSRQNKDLTTLDACLTNFQSAAASTETNLVKDAKYTIAGTTISSDKDKTTDFAKLTASFEEFAGYSVGSLSGLFKSSAASGGDVVISVSATGSLSATKGTLTVSAEKSGVNSN